ncbi:MAG: hypothetical protein KBS68_02045 [Clostridiales bacterium]|nr:hypothetical protein [Candidatus Crickella merdequi]
MSSNSGALESAFCALVAQREERKTAQPSLNDPPKLGYRLIDVGININTVRSLAGHADERTTYYNYCFDRAPDAEKKHLVEMALS